MLVPRTHRAGRDSFGVFLWADEAKRASREVECDSMGGTVQLSVRLPHMEVLELEGMPWNLALHHTLSSRTEKLSIPSSADNIQQGQITHLLDISVGERANVLFGLRRRSLQPGEVGASIKTGLAK